MRNKSSPLDFIEFLDKRSPRIIEIIAPLYKKGMSITDIAEQTGLKRHTIWKALKAHMKNLRPQTSVPFTKWRQGRGKTPARPPFGFCFFEGQVIKDPAEYPTLLLIQNLRKQGASISSIMSTLNSKGIKSRMKKPWSYNVVKAIIQRSNNSILESINIARGAQHESR